MGLILTIEAETFKEMREKIAQHYGSLMNIGFAEKDGKISVVPDHTPGRFVETPPHPVPPVAETAPMAPVAETAPLPKAEVPSEAVELLFNNPEAIEPKKYEPPTKKSPGKRGRPPKVPHKAEEVSEERPWDPTLPNAVQKVLADEDVSIPPDALVGRPAGPQFVGPTRPEGRPRGEDCPLENESGVVQYRKNPEAPPDEPPVAKVTRDELSAIARRLYDSLGDEKGREKIVEILASYKVKRISELAEVHLDGFAEACKAASNG